MFGNFINGAAQAIDKQNGELPRDTVDGPNAGSNMHASPFQGAARGVMANYNQSAGQSWEQTNTFARVVDTRRRWANNRVRLASAIGRRSIG